VVNSCVCKHYNSRCVRVQLFLRGLPEASILKGMARTTTRPSPPPELSERQLEAWLGLLYAHSALIKQVDAELLAAHRLPLSAHEILFRVRNAEGGHLSVSELAGTVLVSPSRVSRLVDELGARGLVERQACPTDARVTHVVITDEGRSFIEDADATLHAALRRHFVDRLSGGDVDRLAAIWRKLNDGGATC
jgi:DNA-binding MarR family transcriptional regulator